MTVPSTAFIDRLPVFSAGFRPFFLGAAIWGALAMALWLAVLTGAIPLADPFAWHVHEMLFGYLSAAMAGFLLTAAPSWTKQSPLRGRALAGLWLAWALARLAMLGLGMVPILPLALLELAMPLTLCFIVGRQILVSENWRNLAVLGALAVFTLADALYLWEVAQGWPAAQGFGARLGIGAAVFLISVVGGRIAPNFTRNWLNRRGQGPLPLPAGGYDILCHVVIGVALVVWAIWPEARVAGGLLLLAGALHVWRMRSWQSLKTLSDPLLWVLHAGYAFLPVGALALGAATMGGAGTSPALHLWTVGAVGVTTLAVMTRATLAHSGGPLVALPGSQFLYLCLVAAAVLRATAGIFPDFTLAMQFLAAIGWIVAFGGIALLYAHRHLRSA
ncbi:NnrS family protein [Tropicimonas marinistellae]|uniref:NnrS family protein n=1 Tax=Tropicimonas marinistellae TaxID=1739787 RepID=UPI000836491B|nr:NnrS family protein [Tropicimonas marinistellae]